MMSYKDVYTCNAVITTARPRYFSDSFFFRESLWFRYANKVASYSSRSSGLEQVSISLIPKKYSNALRKISNLLPLFFTFYNEENKYLLRQLNDLSSIITISSNFPEIPSTNSSQPSLCPIMEKYNSKAAPSKYTFARVTTKIIVRSGSRKGLKGGGGSGRTWRYLTSTLTIGTYPPRCLHARIMNFFLPPWSDFQHS